MRSSMVWNVRTAWIFGAAITTVVGFSGCIMPVVPLDDGNARRMVLRAVPYETARP